MNGKLLSQMSVSRHLQMGSTLGSHTEAWAAWTRSSWWGSEQEKQQQYTAGSKMSYLKNLCRYWRLQGDQEKTPLRPANVGDMMLPSDFLHIFPSPSWTMPKLWEREMVLSKQRAVYIVYYTLTNTCPHCEDSHAPVSQSGRNTKPSQPCGDRSRVRRPLLMLSVWKCTAASKQSTCPGGCWGQMFSLPKSISSGVGRAGHWILLGELKLPRDFSSILSSAHQGLSEFPVFLRHTDASLLGCVWDQNNLRSSSQLLPLLTVWHFVPPPTCHSLSGYACTLSVIAG